MSLNTCKSVIWPSSGLTDVQAVFKGNAVLAANTGKTDERITINQNIPKRIRANFSRKSTVDIRVAIQKHLVQITEICKRCWDFTSECVVTQIQS